MGRWGDWESDQFSRFPIPDSRFPTPNSQFPIPDSRFPIPDSRLPTPDSRLPILFTFFKVCDSIDEDCCDCSEKI
ncbi:MAG: hypothetical protein F6J94_28280 [Moorea sp. SIO1F2]|uniref:hypothetical protein n=1 Tax=Moorena sp. SIO1F2 TaxID=2607819 RepID=UPI0013B7065A|nr:hypothetical protein [Moorena sp. SIO1F2]NET85650.1 hypothetical protein [Moorena sp. SIO1F2]